MTGKASELRAWLRDRPGWHFTCDILDGLGLTGWRERQPYADSLRSSSEHGFLDRAGTRTAIRYRYVREPAR